MQNFEEFKQALKAVQETIEPATCNFVQETIEPATCNFVPVKEQDSQNKQTNYMFFANLKKIRDNADKILALNAEELDALLLEHDWAIDHISSANENIEQVTEFLTNLK